MKALVKTAVAAALAAVLAPAAFAQIISTSLPTAQTGAGRDRFSAHIMATPFAKWDYKEVYGNEKDHVEGDLGLINGRPNSSFMAAAEMAFTLGESNWSMAVGGWYNKIGNKDFSFDGTYYGLNANNDIVAGSVESEKATIPVDLTLSEGHLALFYKAVGVQGGIVHTNQKSNGDFIGNVIGNNRSKDFPGYAPFDEQTNDYTAFGVVRLSRERWGVSAGAGGYFKQGITGSPLRFTEDKVVFSGFVTGNLAVYKGLGVDVSYWYIAKTDQIKELENLVSTNIALSDSQSRFTIGIGYSF